MRRDLALKALCAALKELAKEKRIELERRKCEALKGFRRKDFVWHYLLQSFSTMGRASGWHGIIGNKDNYLRVTYEALERLTPQKRSKEVELTCRMAKIRMPKKKAEFILACFEYVTMIGGPEKAKRELTKQRGTQKKIEFLEKFPGIGPKYARNIMMDVYHPEFRNSVAIDARIKSISKALGLRFTDHDYEGHESFYLEAARCAGLNGWELDRLIFNHKKELIEKLGSTALRNR